MTVVVGRPPTVRVSVFIVVNTSGSLVSETSLPATLGGRLLRLLARLLGRLVLAGDKRNNTSRLVNVLGVNLLNMLSLLVITSNACGDYRVRNLVLSSDFCLNCWNLCICITLLSLRYIKYICCDATVARTGPSTQVLSQTNAVIDLTVIDTIQ